jgi:hypothetical protein
MRARHAVVAIVCMSVVGLLAGCSSTMPLVRAYPGAALPETGVSIISCGGSGFPDIYLYSVDGKPMMEQDDRLVPATYNDFASLGFSVAVLPGDHVLEFYNVHKTPFDKAPLNYQSIRFTTEAGKAYTMTRAGDSWKVTSGNDVVPSTVAPVPVLAVPAESEPRAVLEFRKAADTLVAYVFRIDGRISPNMSYMEPRWVAFNTAGTMPMTIRDDLRAIHMPLVDPTFGKFAIGLAPGHHVIEYTTDYMVLAYKCMGDAVRRVEFDAVAGAKYRIVVEPGAYMSSSLGSQVKIVAE